MAIHAGVDMTTDPPSLFISISTKVTRFKNVKEAHELALALVSLTGRFLQDKPAKK